MELIQSKISKTSRLISGILLVGCIAMGLGAIGLIIAVIALFSHGSELGSFLQVIFAGQVVSGAAVPSTLSIVMAVLLALALLAVMFFLFSTLRQIFKDLGNGQTPFSHRQVSRIRKVALLSLILCVMENLTEAFAQYFLFKTNAFSIDIMWLVFTIVIYCLAYIFDYGAQLQRQADETL